MNEALIKTSKKRYKAELPTALQQFRNWYPDHPEKRERLALLALYVSHHKQEIEGATDPEGVLRSLFKGFGMDAFEVGFVLAGFQMILNAAERQRKKEEE